MKGGHGLQNKFLNKKNIKIYQLPLIERIMVLFSAVFLNALPILMFIFKYPNLLDNVILLVAASIYSGYAYCLVFKVYIKIDFKQNRIIVREFPGIKKFELKLSNVKKIQFSDGEPKKYKDYFTVDIISIGYTKKITSWSMGLSSMIVIFNKFIRQKRRILKFIDKYNSLLINYSKLI